MSIKIPGNESEGEIRNIGWVAGTVGSLLLISAGLELLAHQIFGQIDVDTLIWALALGFWTYVLGFTGFIIFLGRWLVDWRRVGASRTVMDQLSPTESNRRRFEEHELKGAPQILEQAVAPVVPDRLSRHSDDRNKVTSSTRVA
ncbi:MAG: hypothetical protein L0Z46_03810 [Nitrospiraceae bacterium]|nr:hypothetical protein [Nitrospiraceae bacterium]